MVARSWHDGGEGSSVFESVPVDRPDIPSDLGGKGSERSFTSAISHGCHDVVYGRRCLGDIGGWLIDQSETLSVSRAISGQRSIPLIFLCVVVFHVSPRSSCNLRSNVNREVGDGGMDPATDSHVRRRCTNYSSSLSRWSN